MFGIEPGIFWILRKLSGDQRPGRVIIKSCFDPDRQPFGHEVIWCDSQSLAHEVVLRSRTPCVLRLGSNGAAGIFISLNKNGCRYSTEARGNPCAYPEMSPSVLLTAVRNCFPCAPSAKNNIVNSETSEMKPASEVLWVWETLCMNPPSFCCSPKFVIFTGRNGRVSFLEQC
jgi:hypothetical protein